MKKNRKFEIRKNTAAHVIRNCEMIDRTLLAASAEEKDLLSRLNSSLDGLNPEQVANARERYGMNRVSRKKEDSLAKELFHAFINPFTAILCVLAVISVFTDVVFSGPGEENWATVAIITSMVAISGLLRFIQEKRSGNAAAKLQNMVTTSTCVKRANQAEAEIPLEKVVVGDIICLSAGDLIPADVRILSAKDLFVSQSALTGESEPVEKLGFASKKQPSITDTVNLAFMGSSVISGSARAVVIATGDDTQLGRIAESLNQKPEKSCFEKGVNEVSWVLIRFMLVMVPVVFVLNVLTKGNWLSALLYSISIAVGLTPEMLPMIVTANLAKGSVAMSRKKVIIKNLNAIQNLGSIDILCTDKTGTLTQDKVVLEYYLNISGQEDSRILRHAYLNSYFQTGLKNLIDLAVISRQDSLGSDEIRAKYTKVDEIPFDFNRRRMSVVVQDQAGKTQLVTKGAVEEMLGCCSFADYDGKIVELNDEVREFVLGQSRKLNAKGMRVLAVAHKSNPAKTGEFSVKDESDMVLIGFLALLDPPKATAASAIRALHDSGVGVKILTGDNEQVAEYVGRQVRLPVSEVLTGPQMDELNERELSEKAETVTIFAKLSPEQKKRVVCVLRKNGHSVGFMGDGINDTPAMKAADAGISVDSAVDIAKESADVILLEKDLNVLEDGILEGRKTYANTIKYIKMTASSNFGNMFSVLAASAFLPFIPMQALHLILLNLVYDLSCTAIPWDNVDAEFLKKPRKWDASSISKFMLWIGPTSSVFDILTFVLMYFVVCPMVCGGLMYHQITSPAIRALFIAVFQAGWFVESMWSQTLVIHMIRTPKIPFLQSRASLMVTLLTFAGIAVITLIPFTSFGQALGFAVLPASYFFWLAAIILGYMVLATVMKKLYIKRYGELL